MRFESKTFVTTVSQFLHKGEEALQLLIDAYLWAQHHLKEIHAVSPEYQQAWLRQEVRRIFNVDITLYVRTAKRLGGGHKPEEFSEGRAMIARFGVFESFRAEKLLTEDQMAQLRIKIPKDASPEVFRQTVDRIAAKNQLDAKDSDATTTDPRLEILRLRKENEILRKENEKLKADLQAAASRLNALKATYQQAFQT